MPGTKTGSVFLTSEFVIKYGCIASFLLPWNMILALVRSGSMVLFNIKSSMHEYIYIYTYIVQNTGDI